MAKDSKQHVLLVTYYWPPAGGSGVQRWLFFVKYLVALGHKVDVLTVSDPTAAPKDDSLLSHVPEGVGVHQMAIWEPGRGLYQFASEGQQKMNLFSRSVRWIRANLFFPDARYMWIGKGKRWVGRYIKTHQPDWLITTGPPHSVHMIGYAHRNRPHTRWLADFRDPWAEFFVNQSLPMTTWTRKRHHKWEKKVVSAAHQVLTTTESLKKHYQKWNPQTEVLCNGFEKVLKGELSTDFTLCYAGSLKANQSADVVWEAIESLSTSVPEFGKQTEVHMYGQTDPSLHRKVSAMVPHGMVTWHGYQPKSIVDEALATAHVLLFFGNNHANSDKVINAKIFEYMASGRPVLAIVESHGDLSAFVQKHNLGVVFLYSEKEQILDWLRQQFIAYTRGAYPKNTQIDLAFSRENQTAQLATLLTKRT